MAFERLKFWKKDRTHGPAAAQVGQMISSFDMGNVKSMAAGLKQLAKDVETEYKDFSDIADSLTKFSEAANGVREQITIIRFLSNLSYIDAGALSTLETKVDELEKLVQQGSNLQQANPMLIRSTRKKAEEIESLFVSFEAKRADFIKNAPTTLAEIKSILAGAEKLKVSTNLGTGGALFGGGNGTLNNFLQSVANHLKRTGAHTSADLEVLNEQIMKLDSLLDGTATYIQDVESKGINMKAAKDSMSGTVTKLIAMTGAILNHAQKHEEVFRRYTTVSDSHQATIALQQQVMTGSP